MATSPELLVGQLLGTRYRVVRRVGAGAMGTVYEGINTLTQARVAIKVLHRDLAQDPALLERFRREVRVTSSLTDPHVVRVYDFAEPVDGSPYMVMEYLEGEDLETRLRRGPLTVDGAMEMLNCVGSALAEAHAAGIIHRDIKPANIFYAKRSSTAGTNPTAGTDPKEDASSSEVIKLLDFGLSKSQSLSGSGLTQFGQVLGTVWYMSPEQSRGGELTPASDLFSLGVVLYEALSGVRPFDTETPYEHLFKLQSADPRPLMEVAPQLPLALDNVFARVLARNPADRYSSVQRLRDEVVTLFEMGSDRTSVVRTGVKVPTAKPTTKPPPPVISSPKVPVASSRPPAISKPKIPVVVPPQATTSKSPSSPWSSSNPSLQVPGVARPRDETEHSTLETPVEAAAPSMSELAELSVSDRAARATVMGAPAFASEGNNALDDPPTLDDRPQTSPDGLTRVTGPRIARPDTDEATSPGVAAPRAPAYIPAPRLAEAIEEDDPEEQTVPGDLGRPPMRRQPSKPPMLVPVPRAPLAKAEPESELESEAEEHSTLDQPSLESGNSHAVVWLVGGAGIGLIFALALLWLAHH